MIVNRDNGIDVARCISNYMIILLHASAVQQYCSQDTIEASFWDFIYSDVCPAALPVLFLISGYLLFKSFTMGDYLDKMKRRVCRLLVPYISWNTFFIIFYIIAGLFIHRLSSRVDAFQLYSFSGIIDKLISLTSHPIDGPLWFIRTLFVYSLLSPVMYLFLKNIYSRIIFVLIVVATGLYCASIGLSSELALTYPPYSLIMFFIGGVIAQLSVLPTTIFKNKGLIFFSFTVLVLISIFNERSTSPIGKEMIVILSYFLKAIILIGLIYNLNVNRLGQNCFFVKLRELSFFAYAGHFLFCSILLHLVAPHLNFIETGKQTILTLIFCLGGTALMWLVYFTSRKTFPSFLKFFDGNLRPYTWMHV